MKHSIKIFFSLFVVITIILSCKKNTFKVTERVPSEGSAQVKLAFFSAYTVTPTAILYINDKAVSNTLSAPISFPGGGLNMNGSLNGDYLFVTPGVTKIQGFRPFIGTGNIMSKLFEFNETFNANTFYTYFITDTAATTTGFAIEDKRSKPDSGFVRFKFVNAMPNVPSIDLYKGSNESTATLFKAAIAYKAVSDNFDLSIPVSDSFFIRSAGALISTPPIARRAFTASLFNQRVYTLLARGYNSGTINLLPNLSVIVNQ
ncbi:MAG: DUF4397 domain-containing protein [Pedobacter sp.]|nr:DUF4397 domain-containing protein [Pedobacter sp.]